MTVNILFFIIGDHRLYHLRIPFSCKLIFLGYIYLICMAEQDIESGHYSLPSCGLNMMVKGEELKPKPPTVKETNF